MGKKGRNRNTKLKDAKKPANDHYKTETISASNTTEVKEDEKEVTKNSQRIAEETQSSESILHNVTTVTEEKESGNKSTEDIAVADQSSHGQESFMSHEEIKETLNKIEETVIIYKFFVETMERISSTQYAEETNSIFDSYLGLDNILMHKHRDFFANEARIIRLNEENIDRIWNIFYSSSDRSKHDNTAITYQVSRVLEKVRNVKDPEEVEEESIITLFIQFRNFLYNTSVDDIQKPENVPQKLTVEKKCKKGSNRCIGNIQEVEKSSHTKAEDNSEMKYTKERANLCTGGSIPDEISNEDIRSNLNKYNKWMISTPGKNLGTSRKIKEEKIEEKKTEEKDGQNNSLDEIEVSKDKTDEINDIIKELEKFQDHKNRKESDSFIDYFEMPGQLSLNTIKDKNEKGTDKFLKGIQDLDSNKDIPPSNQEIEDSTNEDKFEIISNAKTKTLRLCDSTPGLEEFISQQQNTLDGNIRKYRNRESDQMRFERNIYPGKESVLVVARSEYYDKTTGTADYANESIEELILAEKDNEPNEVVGKLDKNDNIYFKFETDDMQINAGGKWYGCSLEEKEVVTFDFNDENIHISFIGNKILVKTPNNEFDIYIRKSDPIILTSETEKNRIVKSLC